MCMRRAAGGSLFGGATSSGVLLRGRPAYPPGAQATSHGFQRSPDPLSSCGPRAAAQPGKEGCTGDSLLPRGLV